MRDENAVDYKNGFAKRLDKKYKGADREAKKRNKDSHRGKAKRGGQHPNGDDSEYEYEYDNENTTGEKFKNKNKTSKYG